jgi:osmoprotectant transport system permease protein
MATTLGRRGNPVLVFYLALAALAAYGLPFLRVAPNRLLSGEPVYLGQVLQLQDSLLGAAWVWGLVGLLCVANWMPWQRFIQASVVVAMGLSLAGLWQLAGQYASVTSQPENVLSRTSFGAAFWALGAIVWLIALDAINRLKLTHFWRLLVQSALLVPLVLLLAYSLSRLSASGVNAAQNLSILQEYANQSDVLGAAILRHLQIVLMAILPAVLLGVPLAWGMTRNPGLQKALFPVLNVIQTIPSIALFGLLMAPLGWIAIQIPSLSRAGISGIGIAPAVIALLLYALLPIVRSTLAGLAQVPVEVCHAARAIGMSPRQVLWQIELPLALPVLLIGLRTAVVQTTGLAAVSALVGAGGLGQIMFDGLFSAANELVILGVIPIVLLAMMADTFFKVIEAFIKERTC